LTVDDRSDECPGVNEKPSGAQPFAAFARQHEAALRATALRLCGNAPDANDLVQDTFERGLRHFERFQQGTNGQAWLLTILRRLFLDRCRAWAGERRADVEPEEVEARVAAPEAEEAPAWASVQPEQLRAALERLPEEFRVVYQLHALEGCSYNEIAARLGLPKATVGTRLIRARRKLRELLLPQHHEVKDE
jgi:RNA polymerase sigma-70 factor (ECF subfamily)